MIQLVCLVFQVTYLCERNSEDVLDEISHNIAVDKLKGVELCLMHGEMGIRLKFLQEAFVSPDNVSVLGHEHNSLQSTHMRNRELTSAEYG